MEHAGHRKIQILHFETLFHNYNDGVKHAREGSLAKTQYSSMWVYESFLDQVKPFGKLEGQLRMIIQDLLEGSSTNSGINTSGLKSFSKWMLAVSQMIEFSQRNL